MKVAAPEVLRATSPSQALRCGGRAFWSTRKDLFPRSVVTQRIGTFWSHSWHGQTKTKIWLLLLQYNGFAAILFGTLAAVIMCALSSCGLLPAYSKAVFIRREAEMEYFDMAPWAHSAGCLVSGLSFFLWRASGSIFFDRICIHQHDEELKWKSLVSIGGFIKQSQNMLVLWDATYVERLWCIFELAAFLKSQDEEPSKRLWVRPTFLAPCTLALYYSFVILGFIPFAFTDASRGPQLVLPVVFIVFLTVAGHMLRSHQRSIRQMLAQLGTFSIVHTKAQCCTVGHRDPITGTELICDRDILVKCIFEWFGSIENFDKEVQSKVRSALAEGLGRGSMPYPWSLAAIAPLLWTHLDAIAGRLRAGEVTMAADVAIYALTVSFGIVPVVLTLAMRLTKWTQRRRSWLICDLGVTLGITTMAVALIALLYQFYLWATLVPIPLLGASIYAVLLSVIGFLTWRCQKKTGETVGKTPCDD
eukprot:Skav219535  [mRNA]  locus=scaffold30:795072:796496:- [translate_table: standard]